MKTAGKYSLPSIIVRLMAGCMGIVALLLVSPLLLTLPAGIFSVDWSLLSDVGQSYTGVAAVLSGGALVGIVYSIRLQQRQNAIIQGQLVRDMQFRLMDRAMTNPDFAAFLSPPGSSFAEAQRYAYLTQWFRYLEFGYRVGEISANELSRILIEDFFGSIETRRWWLKYSTDYWKQDSDRAFYSLAEEAHVVATRNAAAADNN